MYPLIVAFIFQEPISSAIALTYALKEGVPAYAIHILYISLTIIDMYIGYTIGSYFHTKHSDKKVVRFLQQRADYFFPSSDKYGKHVMFFFVNPSLFPLTPLLLPFLKFSLKEAIVLMLVSNLTLWYSGLWGLVLGYMSESGISVTRVIMVIPLLSVMTWRLLKKK